MSRKLNLIDYLSKGKETAKTAKELQILLGCKTVRAVTREINRLRNSGEIILSSNTGEFMGFYLPDTKDEIYHFVRSMYSRIREIKKAVTSAEQELKKMGGDNE